MQEENALSNKFPLVQLTTPPSKGSGHESGSKVAAAAMTGDTVDSPPYVSPTASGQSKGDEEAMPNTSSNVTVDSSTVVEALVSGLLILSCSLYLVCELLECFKAVSM